MNQQTYDDTLELIVRAREAGADEEDVRAAFTALDVIAMGFIIFDLRLLDALERIKEEYGNSG